MSKSEKDRKAEAEARIVSDQFESLKRMGVFPDLTKAITSFVEKYNKEDQEEQGEPQKLEELESPKEAQEKIQEMNLEWKAGQSYSETETRINVPYSRQLGQSQQQQKKQDSQPKAQEPESKSKEPDDQNWKMGSPEEMVRKFESQKSKTNQEETQQEDSNKDNEKRKPGEYRAQKEERRKQWRERRGAPLEGTSALERWKQGIKTNAFNDDSRFNFNSTVPNTQLGGGNFESHGMQVDFSTAADTAAANLSQTLSQLASIAVNLSIRLRDIERTLEEASV